MTEKESGKVAIATKEKEEKRKPRRRGNVSKDRPNLKNQLGSNDFNMNCDSNFKSSEFILKENAFYIFTFAWNLFNDNASSLILFPVISIFKVIARVINEKNRDSFHVQPITEFDIIDYFEGVLDVYSRFVQVLTFGSISETALAGSKTQNYATEYVNKNYFILNPVPNIRYVKQSLEDLYLPSSLQSLVRWFLQPFTSNALGYGLVYAFVYKTDLTGVIKIRASKTDVPYKDVIQTPINFDRNAYSKWLYNSANLLREHKAHIALSSCGLFNNSQLKVDFKPNPIPVFSAVKYSILSLMSYYTADITNSEVSVVQKSVTNNDIIDMHINAINNLWWMIMVNFNSDSEYFGIIKPFVAASSKAWIENNPDTVTFYPWITNELMKSKIRQVDGSEYDKFETQLIQISENGTGVSNWNALLKVRAEESLHANDIVFCLTDDLDRFRINSRFIVTPAGIKYVLNPDFVNSDTKVNSTFLQELSHQTISDLIKL